MMRVCLLLLGMMVTVSLFGCGASLVQNEEGNLNILDLSTLPKLDEVEKGDTAASASLSSLKTTHNATGSTSSTGCMGLHFFRPEAINRVRQAELFKCYAAVTQDRIPGMVIPENRYAYYRINFAGTESILFRVKNETSGSTKDFQMDVCKSTDGISFQRVSEFTASGNSSTATWTGSVINHVTGGFDCTNYTMVMNSAAVMDEEFDFNNVRSLETSSCYCQNPSTSNVESGTSCGSLFTLGFTYQSSGRNTTTGSYSIPSVDVNGRICTEFNGTEGAGILNYTIANSFYYSDTEGFQVSTSPTVIPTSEVDFFGEFACSSIPDEISEETLLSNVTFTRSWDCLLPPGQLPLEIDSSIVDYSACDTLSEKISKASRVNSTQCFEEQGVPEVAEEQSSGGSTSSSGGTTGGSSSGSGGSGGSSIVCGNGTTETGEQCDDGNTSAGDGCSATCQTEVSLPNSWTMNSTKTHTCLSDPPNSTITNWKFTKTSETSSTFIVTITVPGGGGTSVSGTKSGNDWTENPDTATGLILDGCTYSLGSSLSGNINPFGCTTGTKTYTKTSGDCSFIPASGSCVANLTLACTTP